MIQKVEMYTVICDNCGKDANEGSDYSCFGTEEDSKEVAHDSDWITEDDKDYCPDCISYDDEDNLVLKPITPTQ